MKRRVTALTASALWLALGGLASAGPPPAPPISGVVRHAETPLPGVLVIFFNVGDSSLARVHTASDGTFVLASAPAGVYDLVAYKRGYEPAMQRLWHQAGAAQVSSVSIALTRKGAVAAAEPAPETIWDMRDRLPTDVLREIAIEEVSDKTTPPAQRVALNQLIQGELRTVTEASASSPSALSRAELGLHGGLPNGWQYGISGDYSRLGNVDVASDTTTGNAAGLAVDVAPSSDEHLSLSTRHNTLSFAESPASLQTGAVTWSRGQGQGDVESLGARYIEETNLYRATALGTTLFPLASRTLEVDGQYGRPATLDAAGVTVGMVYRYREASVGASGVGSDGVLVQSAPDADLSAATAFKVSDRIELQGGVVARYIGNAPGGYGVAPEGTVRYTIANGTTVYVHGLYRAFGSTSQATAVMPRIASIEESQEPAATRSFAVGFQRDAGANSQLQIEVSEQRMGELVRAFFEGDFLTDFDSIYLLDGNNVRQYKASFTQRLSNTLSGNVAVRYGSIDGSVASPSAASYGIEANPGRFWSARASVEVLPTHTGIAVLVRKIQQDIETPAAKVANDSDKLSLSVSQDLSVIGLTPFGAGWKLVVAIENTKGTPLSSQKDEAVVANRLLGGVAVSF
jgi:Carboxypeptidase regulatory-like domain